MPNESAVLVDTNVFVYAFTLQDSAKFARSTEVLDEIASTGMGCVSTQVLNELFSRITRGVQDDDKIAEAEDYILAIINNWEVFHTTGEAVAEAMRGVRRYRIAFWDSLIWASAKLSGVQTILSEDFSHGRNIEGVTILNPFAEDFALETLSV